jgi:hypothetical protein
MMAVLKTKRKERQMLAYLYTQRPPLERARTVCHTDQSQHVFIPNIRTVPVTAVDAP